MTSDNGDCYNSIASCKNIPLKEWYHLAFSFNGTNFFFYCNGEFDPNNTVICVNYPSNIRTKMTIGSDMMNPGDKNFYGMYDEFRKWKQYFPIEEVNARRFRKLTAQEITNPNLTFYYSFDEGTGYHLKDSGQNNLTGNLGGTGSDMRIANAPIWVGSNSPLVNSFCVLETRFGKTENLTFKIYILVENGTLDISSNFSTYGIQLKILSLPGNGSLLDYEKNTTISAQNYSVINNKFLYVAPKSSNLSQISDEIDYCLYFNTETLCNVYKILVTHNTAPFAENAGYTLWYDGLDDYLFAESFRWPLFRKNHSGGTPTTVEWWQLIRDSDFIVDNYQAAGAISFSIGFGDTNYTGCKEFCWGRFQAHTPWADTNAYFDYGWNNVDGSGRDGTNFQAYFNKWTHIALVSGGNESKIHTMYFDGQIPINGDWGAISGQLITRDLQGLTIGCLHGSCLRAAIDEFRVWNKTRTLDEIRSTMNQKIADPKNTPNLYAYYNFNEIFNNNEILDLGVNNYTLKGGACSNDSEYYGSELCFGNFENISLPASYPTSQWSTAPVSDIIYNISILESQNFSFLLNGTDLNADEITLKFLSTPQFYNITYNNQSLNYGVVLKSPNYFLGTKFNQWSVQVFPESEYAGRPLDKLTFILNDGITDSIENVVYLNVDCNLGRFLDIDDRKCHPCSPGSFANTTGSTFCFLCPQYYYQPNSSAINCAFCPEGYITLGEGSSFCVFNYKGCIFKNPLSTATFGIIFNCVVIGLIGVVLSVAIALYNYKTKDTVHASMRASIVTSFAKISKDPKKKKLSTPDILDIVQNCTMFFQLMNYAMILDGKKIIDGGNGYKAISIFKSIFSVPSLDVNHDSLAGFNFINEVVKGIQITIYILIFSLACFSVIFRAVTLTIFRKKGEENEKKTKLANTIIKIDQILLGISETFFIPICLTFFKVYSCTEESIDVPAFNDDYCDLTCWERTHLSFLIVSSVIFIPYSYFFFVSLVEIQSMRAKNKLLHLKRNPIFTQNQLFLQLMLSVTSKLLAFNPKIEVCFILSLFLMIFLMVYISQPYYHIKKMNKLLEGFFLILFITTLCSLLSLFIDDLNVSIVFLSAWFGTGLFAIITVLRCPPILESKLPSQFSIVSKKTEMEMSGNNVNSAMFSTLQKEGVKVKTEEIETGKLPSQTEERKIMNTEIEDMHIMNCLKDKKIKSFEKLFKSIKIANYFEGDQGFVQPESQKELKSPKQQLFKWNLHENEMHMEFTHLNLLFCQKNVEDILQKSGIINIELSISNNTKDFLEVEVYELNSTASK